MCTCNGKQPNNGSHLGFLGIQLGLLGGQSSIFFRSALVKNWSIHQNSADSVSPTFRLYVKMILFSVFHSHT